MRAEENLDADDRDVFQLIPKRGLFSLAIDTTDNIDVSDTNILDDSEIVDEIIPLADFDNDGIPDDWEINGYTKKNGVIVKWENSFDPSVYKISFKSTISVYNESPLYRFRKSYGVSISPKGLTICCLASMCRSISCRNGCDGKINCIKK
nr:binary toxin-like calcium binding domain-containing protein [Bacillus thuringiensis]